MKNFILTGLSLLTISIAASAQGCVIVRNISGFVHYNINDHSFSRSEWVFDAAGRYFRSFRDFKGEEDLKTPDEDLSENNVFTFDFTLTRILSKGWSLTFNIPYTANTRTTNSEHGGKGTPRYATHSVGLGDMRFTVYKWLFNPSASFKGNIQLGLGLKFPTGDYRYQDYYYRKADSAVLAPVNPSIQLGDGGTGIITELISFYILNKSISFYGNFYYMLNPREQNGTSPLAGRAPTQIQIKSGNTVNSVMDQYTARIGVNYNIKKLAFSGGLRLEGIPVYDVLGGSNGNRRTGYNFSVEPGINYNMKRYSLYLYVPVMVKRETKQSVPDKKITEMTGVYTLTAGGFADYLIFAGVSIKL